MHIPCASCESVEYDIFGRGAAQGATFLSGSGLVPALLIHRPHFGAARGFITGSQMYVHVGFLQIACF